MSHVPPPPVLPPHAIEFVIGAHGSEIGHAVAETEEGGDSGDIPDIFVAETMALKSLEVGITDGLRQVADFHSKVEHGHLARGDVGLAVVRGHLVGDQLVLGTNA
jgi:hypothetical protein